MPRAVKTKAEPAKKVAGGKKKKNNEYNKPEAIPRGEILTDLFKKQWKIGPSIGAGGFGEIYSACKATNSPRKLDDYDHVIKIEPHENGPLFVEMHFYMRSAKLEDINKFCQKRGLKSLGMPHLIGSGSHEINGIKHRFIVMPRYGKDVWSLFLANNRKLPEHTIYRIAIQMIDVFEYIHSCSYVHADLKGANILLGCGKSGASQAYLVDFGLASHYTKTDFKPDPKKMHNGTIEYTSRDAHKGVPTMRGDLEILGYNLINWSGLKLPWENENILSNPSKVQKEKEEFMNNIDESFKKSFQNVPVPIKEFFKYISTLKYNDVPDYEKCRKIFQNGLKSLGKTNTGELDFKLSDAIGKIKAKTSSDDFEAKSPKVKSKRIQRSPLKRHKAITDNEIVNKKVKRNKSPYANKQNKIESISSPESELEKSGNMTPSLNKIDGVRSPTPKTGGSTIVNDNIKPNPKSNKTYEFNLELNVSVDADVIVNVKRKNKTKKEEEGEELSKNDVSGSGTPVVRVRKMETRTKPERKSPRKNYSKK